jgi:hypothetical protein
VPAHNRRLLSVRTVSFRYVDGPTQTSFESMKVKDVHKLVALATSVLVARLAEAPYRASEKLIGAVLLNAVGDLSGGYCRRCSILTTDRQGNQEPDHTGTPHTCHRDHVPSRRFGCPPELALAQHPPLSGRRCADGRVVRLQDQSRPAEKCCRGL